MALKLNIRPDIEKEMESLISLALVRSKTEYINKAIQEMNAKLKRQQELAGLKAYFKSYQTEAAGILNEFARLKTS